MNQLRNAADAPSRPPKLLDLVRERTCACRLAQSVGEAYVRWARRYILFHNKQHPRELGSADLDQFLGHLAEHEHAPVPECSQARAAINFLYREVLHIPQRLAGRLAARRESNNSVAPAPSCAESAVAIATRPLEENRSANSTHAKEVASRPTTPLAGITGPQSATPPQEPKLLDRVHAALRLGHFSRRTEEA